MDDVPVNASLNPQKCGYIFDKGKSQGTQCNTNRKPDQNYCKRHTDMMAKRTAKIGIKPASVNPVEIVEPVPSFDENEIPPEILETDTPVEVPEQEIEQETEEIPVEG